MCILQANNEQCKSWKYVSVSVKEISFLTQFYQLYIKEKMHILASDK